MREIPTGEVERLNLLGDALDGARGDDQQRIARVGLQWLCLLLAKNADYGSSVWKVPILAPECSAEASIRVRMTDKVERLHNLVTSGNAEVAESIEDTVRDLGAYCLLWLARPRK